MLLPFGSVEGYGRTQTEFPPLGKILLGKKGRFDQLGDAVLERSIVQRSAVQLRNWVSYRLVGFVDNELPGLRQRRLAVLSSGVQPRRMPR